MTSLITLLLKGLAVLALYFAFLRQGSRSAKIAAFIVFLALVGGLLGWGLAIGTGVNALLNSLVFFIIQAGLFALLTLALNVHWGYTGLFNIGVAGFFAIGGYVSAILVHPPTVSTGFSAFLAPYQGLPFGVGLVAAMIAAGLIALLVGLVTLRLRADFLAIATIGISEILRLFVLNEQWLTEGPQGVSNIPQPLHNLLVPRFLAPDNYNWFYLMLVVIVILVAFGAIERIARSPWGRALRAIREDEDAADSLGKNVFAFKLQSLVVGAMVMGATGALTAHFLKFIGPQSFDPVVNTFLIWVMLVVGGTANNRGAILGAYLMWAIWTSTLTLNDLLPPTLLTPLGKINVQAQLGGPLRVMLVALVLELILLYRPRGLLGEEKYTSILVGKKST